MRNGKLSFLDRLIDAPRMVFLLDALGALLTSFMLFGVLAQFEHYFGMPQRVLYLLSLGAFCLFIYSISCYRFIISKWKPFLVIIIGCNAVYVVLSVFLIIKYIEGITRFGLFYFILELMIILIVISVEYKSYSKLT